MNKRKSQFLYTLIFISPFSLLLWECLLSSANCADLVRNGQFSVSGYFCYGFPQFLQHSSFYDLIFLRAAAVKGAEHWSSALIVAVVPLITFALTKKSRFSFWIGILFPLTHEIYWLPLAWIFKNPVGTIADSIYYAALCIGVSIYVFWSYKAILWNRVFFWVLCGYFGVLAAWIQNGFHITVGGALGQPLLTPYYLDVQTNFFEVFSWIYLGIAFCVFIASARNNYYKIED